MLTIRDERPEDFEQVETLTRKAFYNQYVPGCFEHYLVHIMREHEDFVSELDFVLELDGKIVGNIMYTKAKLVDEQGQTKQILTFGPICVDPAHQRKGYGKKLIQHSFERAKELGYDVVVIFGSPSNYVSSGFRSCKRYNVCMENGKFQAAMLFRELVPNALYGRSCFSYDCPVMAIAEDDARHYDDPLDPVTYTKLPSKQEV